MENSVDAKARYSRLLFAVLSLLGLVAAIKNAEPAFSAEGTYGCAADFTLEVHSPGGNHGDVCRSSEGSGWSCPSGCEKTGSGAPYCQWLGTSTACHESTKPGEAHTSVQQSVTEVLATTAAQNDEPAPAVVEWEGTFNATHADEFPRAGCDLDDCDGDEGGQWLGRVHSKVATACATMWVVNGTSVTPSDKYSCTSCNKGYAFILNRHKSRTGQCKPYSQLPVMLCGVIGGDDYWNEANKKAKVCTKVVSILQQINLGPTGLRTDAINGLNGYSAARCNVRKETTCDNNGACDNRKQVECVEVCKVTRWGSAEGRTLEVANCSSAMCDGEAGPIVCRNTAMME